MQLPTLYAPWRMDYIQSIDKPPQDGCFLCRAAEAADAPQTPASRRRDLLLLWSTEHSIVVINRYPYAHGHLLVAPKAHKADLADLTEAEGLDIHRQTKTAIALLRRAVSAQGFNIGINVGRVAGAGLPGHVHQHVVPRWAGDANFISVVGEVRVVPQAIEQLYDALAAAYADMIQPRANDER
jgi:ATP adenylyltransferase